MNRNRNSAKAANKCYLSLIFLVSALFIGGCGKEKPVKKPEMNTAASVRLDALLENPSTRIQGGIRMHPGNFQAFRGNGWAIQRDFITAAQKRTVLILPDLPAIVKRATLKFRARLPQEITSRRLVISSKEKELAALNLKSGWHDYQFNLPAEDVKRLRFAFDGRKSAEQTFGDFASFELQFYIRNFSKMGNEVRPSILVPANATMSFEVTIPGGTPALSFGAALQRGDHERTFSVALHQANSSRKLAELSVSPVIWRDQQIDLTSYAGKPVRLSLQPSKQLDNADMIAWSSVEILDTSAKREGPNIILFSVDALRPDHVSYYGYPIVTSPNLDAVARKSTVFNRAYCTSPSTLPSHASVMTGLYVGNHHVGKKSKLIPRLQRIPDELVTLAEVASLRNYRTAAITDDGYVSSFYGFQQGFQQYVENNDVEKNEVVTTIDDGITWLKKNHIRPFFLFLHSYEVHEPFTPPLNAFRHLFPNHKLKDDRSPEIYNEWLKDVMTGKVVPTPEEKDLVRKAFDAEIYFFDQQFGRFWKELQKLQLDKNTVVIIFSDHGQQFFDRGDGFGHASTLYVEEVRVPLIIHLPGKAHQRLDQTVSLVDIFPTVARLLGSKERISVDGLDLLQTTGKQYENRAVYYEINYADKALWGMQNHEYKLIVDSERGESFFDIRKDPQEKNSLNSSSPRAMKIMKNLLTTYITQSMAPPRFQDTVTEREEAAELNEKLRALGYLN